MTKELKVKIDRLKENGEDLEFYPTTKDMIRTVFNDVQNADLKDNDKLLDIGAGDGNLFKEWEELIDERFPRDQHGYRPNMMSVAQKYFAIEKSHTLMEYLPKNVVTVGTDFMLQTLIDKEMDIIFCNPPYSQFEMWTNKIIMEAHSTLVYLIIPERWKDSRIIESARKKRGASIEIIHSDDFLNAPRSARAKIDILRVDYRGSYDAEKHYSKRGWASTATSDPFDIWFNSTFEIHKSEDIEFEKPKIFSERVDLVPGNNLIEKLEKLYHDELFTLQETYGALCQMDPVLLKEFDITLDNVREGLKEKIKGLKHKYWNELFNNLTKITDRLTSKSRESLLSTLRSNLNVDFSASNAYAVVMWAMKNANEYYDRQLIHAYEELVNQESILNYKSNRRFTDDDWRFNSYDFVKCQKNYYINDKLDYRIVCHRVGGIFSGESWRTYDQRNGLSNRAYDYIQDLCTVAKNLGYDVSTIPLQQEWTSGKNMKFYTMDDDLFMTVKAFKNGNLHFKFDQNFLRKFNVEFGRLKGWINNKSQASEEMDIPVEKIDTIFNSNFSLNYSHNNLIRIAG